MKILLMLTLFCCIACRQKPTDLTEWKENVLELSQQKLAEIATQLQEDCDSVLLQTALLKADSIKKSYFIKPVGKSKSKKLPD